ncbi:MAG TPA: HAD-IC family P-type ATPase, partial [Candidatus Limnocylindria bacterium]|nr:HAD-IC family P-type ATPase [Candidatus Limnocylindria bacterium]
PIAEAIVRHADSEGLDAVSADTFEALAGRGARATVSGRPTLVGSARLLTENGVDVVPQQAVAASAEAAGQSVVYVAVGGQLAGILTVADTLKPEAPAAVQALQRRDVDVWMITGDRRPTAEAIAAAVGIAPDHVLAEVLPGEKAAKVAALQASGATVAMVGDGINDAPALAQADLGIAIGTGADVAVEASDITILGDDLGAVPGGIGLSKATMRVIRQNLGWAFGYNVLLIPVAAGLLYPLLGLTLSPALAAAAMALSSVSVVTNSLRLRGFRLAPTI